MAGARSGKVRATGAGSARRGQPVYSTDGGRLCPTCGETAARCRCAPRTDETVPARVTARLRLETGGRGGKTVTVVDGLPDNAAFLEELARVLKRALGTGGAVRAGAVELQGDRRGPLRGLLAERGFRVKG